MQKIILAAVIAVIVIMLVLIIMLYRKRVSAGVFNGKKIRDLTTGHCLFVDGAAPSTYMVVYVGGRYSQRSNWALLRSWVKDPRGAMR
jgi:hypothetical protein